MKTFLTGSYAYGTPTSRSDIDLVVYLPDADTRTLLVEKFCGGDATVALKIGNKIDPPLNLIVCKTIAEYDKWWAGTQLCIAEKPITRARAIEIFDNAGVAKGHSGP